MEGPLSEDLTITVLTCKGDLRDPAFPLLLRKLVCKLKKLLCDGKKTFRVTKVEPWNSVRVTFNIPREAAHRLRQLAERGDNSLRDLGILSVQIEGDQVITLTLANNFDDKHNLILGKQTEGASLDFNAGPSNTCKISVSTIECNNNAVGTVSVTSSNVDSSGSSTLGVDVSQKSAHFLSQQSAVKTLNESGTFKSPNVIAPQSGEPLPFITCSSSLTTTSSPSTTSANMKNVQGPRQSQPNVGPFPFASMQHAMHTKQGSNSFTSLQQTSMVNVNQCNRMPVISVSQSQGLILTSVSTQSLTSAGVTVLSTNKSSSVSNATIDSLQSTFIRNPNIYNNVRVSNAVTSTAVNKQAQNMAMAVAAAAVSRCSSSSSNVTSSASSNVALTSPLLVNLLQSDGSGGHPKMMPPPPPPQLQSPSTLVVNEANSKRTKQRKPRKAKEKPPDEATKSQPPTSSITNFSLTTSSPKPQSFPLPSNSVSHIQSGVTSSTQNQSKHKSSHGVHSHFVNIPAGTMPRYPTIHPEAQGQPQVVTSGQLPLRHQQQQPRFTNVVGSPPVVVPSSSPSLQMPALSSRSISQTVTSKDTNNKPTVQDQQQFSQATSSPQESSTGALVTKELKPESLHQAKKTDIAICDSGKTKHLINPFTGHLEPMVSDDEEEDRTSSLLLFPELDQCSTLCNTNPAEQSLADNGKESTHSPDTDSGLGKSAIDASSQSSSEFSTPDIGVVSDSTVSKIDESDLSKTATEKLKIRLKIESKQEIAESAVIASKNKELPLRKLSAHSAPELLEPSSISSFIAEPRVPPLHISLRGPNSAVVVSGRRESLEESEMKNNELVANSLINRKPRSLRSTRAMSAESTLTDDLLNNKNQRKKMLREQRFLSGGGIVSSDNLIKNINRPMIQSDINPQNLPSHSIADTTLSSTIVSNMPVTSTFCDMITIANSANSFTNKVRSSESESSVGSPPPAQKLPSVEANISCETNVPHSVSASIELPAIENKTCAIDTFAKTLDDELNNDFVFDECKDSESLSSPFNNVQNHVDDKFNNDVENRYNHCSDDTLKIDPPKCSKENVSLEASSSIASIVTIKQLTNPVTEETGIQKDVTDVDSQEVPPLIASNSVKCPETLIYEVSPNEVTSSESSNAITSCESMKDLISTKVDSFSNKIFNDKDDTRLENDVPSAEESSLDSSTAPTENVSYSESSSDIVQGSSIENATQKNSEKESATCDGDSNINNIKTEESEEAKEIASSDINHKKSENDNEDKIEESETSICDTSVNSNEVTSTSDTKKSNYLQLLLKNEEESSLPLACLEDKTKPLQVIVTSAVPSFVTTASTSTVIKPSSLEPGGHILILKPNLNSPNTTNPASGDRGSPVGIPTPKTFKVLTLTGPTGGGITVRSTNKFAQLINSSPASPLSPNASVASVSSSINAANSSSPPVRLLVSKVTGHNNTSGGVPVSVTGNSLVNLVVKSVMVPNPSSSSIKLVPAHKTPTSTPLLIPLPSFDKSNDSTEGHKLSEPKNDESSVIPPDPDESSIVCDNSTQESCVNNSQEQHSGTSDVPQINVVTVEFRAESPSSGENCLEDLSCPHVIENNTEGSEASDEDKIHSVALGDHNYTSLTTDDNIEEDIDPNFNEDDSIDAKADNECLQARSAESNLRPSKRKCSENAAELIKACMGLEDIPRKNLYSNINCTPSNSVTSITIRSRVENDVDSGRNEITVETNAFPQKQVVKNSKLRKRKSATESCGVDNAYTSDDDVTVPEVETKSWKNKTRLRTQSKQESVVSSVRPSLQKTRRVNCRDAKKDGNVGKKPVERKCKGKNVSNSSSSRSSRRANKDHNSILSTDSIFVVNDNQEAQTVEIMDDSEEDVNIFGDPTTTIATTQTPSLSLLNKRKARTIVSGEQNEITSSNKRRKVNKDGHR